MSLPAELENIIFSYLFRPKTKKELEDAVNLYCDSEKKELKNMVK